MILHKSKYLEVRYEQKNSMFIEKFFPPTTDMTDDEFKTEMSIIYRLIEKNTPKFVLINLMNMG